MTRCFGDEPPKKQVQDSEISGSSNHNPHADAFAAVVRNLRRQIVQPLLIPRLKLVGQASLTPMTDRFGMVKYWFQTIGYHRLLLKRSFPSPKFGPIEAVVCSVHRNPCQEVIVIDTYFSRRDSIVSNIGISSYHGGGRLCPNLNAT